MDKSASTDVTLMEICPGKNAFKREKISHFPNFLPANNLIYFSFTRGRLQNAKSCLMAGGCNYFFQSTHCSQYFQDDPINCFHQSFKQTTKSILCSTRGKFADFRSISSLLTCLTLLTLVAGVNLKENLNGGAVSNIYSSVGISRSVFKQFIHFMF